MDKSNRKGLSEGVLTMATKNYNPDNWSAVNKADLIAQRQNDLSRGQDEVLSQFKLFDSKLTATLEELDKLKREIGNVAEKNPEVKVNTAAAEEDYEALKKDLQLIAIQNENIFNTFSDRMKELQGKLADLQKAEEKPVKTTKIDYDRLAESLVQRMAVREADTSEAVKDESVQTNEVDYDLLAGKMVGRLQMRDDVRAAKESGIDYDMLADKIAKASIKKDSKEENK